jgi:hypothetical protein
MTGACMVGTNRRHSLRTGSSDAAQPVSLQQHRRATDAFDGRTEQDAVLGARKHCALDASMLGP